MKHLHLSFSLLLTSFSGLQLKAETSKEILVLLVDKTNLTAQLKTLPENGHAVEHIKSFKIAIGKHRGDKEKEGDQKTPEGIYLVKRHIKSRAVLMPKKHGPLAIPLNYPNIIDRKSSKTGHGIWLHGAGDESRMQKENVTEGCIAFYNKDIVKLGKWMKPQRSIVLIANNLDTINQSDDNDAVHKQVLAWAKAWSNRDTDTYASFYAEDFSHKWRKKPAYIAYKRNLFKRYRKMEVKLSHIRVLSHNKYTVTLMNQNFRGDHFKATGSKLLFWKKEGNVWKIIAEQFHKNEFARLSYTRESIAELNQPNHSTQHYR